MAEIWKDITNWGGYQISNLANVKSLDRWIPRGDNGYFIKGQIMKLTLSDRGYYYVELRRKDKTRSVQFVHVLVGRAFVDSAWAGQFDHKNRNKQDNRPCNLRPATASQNGANRTKTKGTSKYKGVSFVERLQTNPWSAQVHFQGKKKHLGYFSTQEQASEAYNKSALEHFGKFARTNEI